MKNTCTMHQSLGANHISPESSSCCVLWKEPPMGLEAVSVHNNDGVPGIPEMR